MYYFDESGRIHRDNGPAIIYSNGKELWFRDGENIQAPRDAGDHTGNGGAQDISPRNANSLEMRSVLPKHGESSGGPGKPSRRRMTGNGGSMGTLAGVNVHFL